VLSKKSPAHLAADSEQISVFCVLLIVTFIVEATRTVRIIVADQCKLFTTTVLQPKDTISTKRCDIYHLLNAEICDSCVEMRILICIRSPQLYPIELRAQDLTFELKQFTAEMVEIQ